MLFQRHLTKRYGPLAPCAGSCLSEAAQRIKSHCRAVVSSVLLSECNWGATQVQKRHWTKGSNEPLCGQHSGNSVGYLASREGKQDRNQRNGHQGVSADIGRRVSTVNVGRVSQQSSDSDGRNGKRNHMAEARI